MDSDSESEDNASEGGSPSKQQPEAEQQQQQQQGGSLPAVSAEQVAANLAAPKGTKRGREEDGASPSGADQLGECGAHPGPCSDACQSAEADEQLLRQKQMQVRAQWELCYTWWGSRTAAPDVC